MLTEPAAAHQHFPDRHPSGLPLLLMAMAAYRFFSTAIFSVLFLHLSAQLGWSYSTINQLYTATSAMTCVGLPLCALWADRELGYRPTLLGGLLFLGIGALLIAVRLMPICLLGVLLFTLGSIFFRAGHAPLLGQLYGTDPEGSARRDTAFFLDMLIGSVGSLFGPAILSAGGMWFGFAPMFGLAGLFLLFSAAILWVGRKTLQGPPAPPSTAERWQGVVGLGAALVLLCEGALWVSQRLLLEPHDVPGSAGSSATGFAALLLSAAAAALLAWLFEGLRRRGVALSVLTRLGAGVMLTAVMLGGVRLLLWRGMLGASLSARVMLGMPLQLPGLLLLPVWMSLVCQRVPRRMQATLLALLAVGIQLLTIGAGFLLTSHR